MGRVAPWVTLVANEKLREAEMKLWPSDTFEVETWLSPGEIVEALRPKIEPTKLIRFSRDHAPYQGELTSDGFRMTRVIHYRNSFLPIITGAFVPTPSGTKVEVHLGLHSLVIAFMCFWFCGVGFASLVILAVVLSGVVHPAFLLIPLGMLGFGWALVSGGFWFEASSQRPLLIKLFRELEASQEVVPLN